MTTLTLHYSEALVRKAVRVFWSRTLGWTYWIACVPLVAALGWSLSSGDRSWVVGLLAAVLGMGVILAVALYFVHLRGAIARIRRMRTPEATMDLGEERFRLTSDVGSSELAWSAISELWVSSDFILAFMGRAQFVTLPMADLGSQGRDVVVAKARNAGVKVREL